MIKVEKRGGNEEEYDVNKIHRVLEWATDGFSNVSVSDIEVLMDRKLELNQKKSSKEKYVIKTTDIANAIIDAAVDLISLDCPNYQYVASRLLLFYLRQEVWKDITPPSFYGFVAERVKRNIYDDYILEKYSEEEFSYIEKHILKHKRDYRFTYAGLKQMWDKYLLRDRKSGEVFETPQFAYILIAMTLFADYPLETRRDYIKDCYNFISTFKINLPTPIVAGVRTKLRQYASCTLIDVGDSIDSIGHSQTAVMKYVADRAGIGLNVGRIRPVGAGVREEQIAEVISTGVIPFLKIFEGTVKSTSQNGKRVGSATVNIPFWHLEIEDVIQLKNNSGTDDNRVRKMDYCVSFSKIFYERVRDDANITLFDPHEASDLYDAFGHEEFDALYEKYERKKVTKKKVKARDLFALFLKERLETGRIYLMNIDHANDHSSFIDSIKMTNLCVTGDTRIASNKGLIKAEDLHNNGEYLETTYDCRTSNGDGSYGVSTYHSTPMIKTAEDVDVFEISTKHGYSIKSTEWHEYYRAIPRRNKSSRWYDIEKVKLHELKIGDRLLIQSGIGQFGQNGSYELGFLLGMVVGDGVAMRDSRNGNCRIGIDLYGSDVDDVYEKVVECREVITGNNFNDHKQFVVDNNVKKKRITSTKIGRILEEKYDFDPSDKLRIPEFIFGGTQGCVSGFLNGVYTCDGTIIECGKIPQAHIQLTSKSDKFLKDIQVLLSNFGIMSNINKNKRNSDNPIHHYTTVDGVDKEYQNSDTWRIDITGCDVDLFMKYIGFSSAKNDKYKEIMSKRRSFGYEGNSSQDNNYTTKITNIEHVGKEDVYDVRQDLNHSVIFNGIATGQCVEITHPTKPLEHIDDTDAEIGICVLGAINLAEVNLDEMERVCDIQVRLLESVIEHQDYPVAAAENFTRNRRSLGIGVTNLAYFLAKNGMNHNSEGAPNLIDEHMEYVQYFLMKASNQLAKEIGPCAKYDRTKYSEGILPIDTYNKNVDKITSRKLSLDWDGLRESILEHGMRHSTLSATMPVESSSIVQNATNGIEPPRKLFTIKKNKSVVLKHIAPGYRSVGNNYLTAFAMGDNKGYLNCASVIQKYTDMSISTNLYYDPAHFEDGKIPMSVMSNDILYAYKMGLKTLYYTNTNDGDKHSGFEDCAGGACKL
jgi:ribonucleotide reductase alpha subunit